MADENKKVSKKKVVYAEIDDEVTVIYDKIRNIQEKHVYVLLPKRAVLFQSVINLKILKRKVEDAEKTFSIITNDSNGIHLAYKAGIEVFNKSNGEGKPVLFSAGTEDEKLRITPLKASVNAIEEAPPTRLTERKLSISELLKKRYGKKTLDISKISQNSPKKKEKSKFVIVAPNRHVLIALVIFIVFVLLVVVYIALPGVTIYLTPSATVLEKSVNITFADYQKNKAELETRTPHLIASYQIETKVQKTITHFATGKKFSEKGANASGKLTIINTTNTIWPLVATTRFQTDDGIIFRIPNSISIPASTNAGPGKVEVYVIADPADIYGAIVGERGNIGPARFFLPGLKESSRAKLYAESHAPMAGGITDFITYISAEDLQAAKSRLNDELLKSAVEELRAAVIKKNDLTNEPDKYKLLEGEGAVKIGNVQIQVPQNLEGKTLNEFTISGSVSVSGVYYDHDMMLQILKNELLLKKSPQKELLRINEESTSYKIFEWDEVHGKIKLTANIKGIEQFSIDPNKENGARLLKKIQDHIAGKDIEEAVGFIQNLPEINKVEIDSWPAWAPTIPNLPDNIEFEIRNAINVE